MKSVGRRKAPSDVVRTIVVETDPRSERDRLSVAWAVRLCQETRAPSARGIVGAYGRVIERL
jgi:hypothetical protein